MYEYIKDGLTAYRNITQSSNVSSLEAVLKVYIKTVEEGFDKAIEGVENPAAMLEEIQEENNPTSFYLNCFDTGYNKQKLDIQQAWKLLVEAYKIELDLICKNRKIEEMYCSVAKKALQKCS